MHNAAIQQNIKTCVQMDVQATTDMPGWKLIYINEHTIIRTIDSYNKILCSLLINETVEVIALISVLLHCSWYLKNMKSVDFLKVPNDFHR